MTDRISECEAGARNHGDFVTCVGDLARTWSDEGILAPNEKGDILHCAARAEGPLRRVQKSGRVHPVRVEAEGVETLSQP